MPIIGLSRELYFTTTTVVDWMDVFTRPVYKRIIIDSLRYCQKHKGLDIFAWVLMSNHLHMIVALRKDGDIIKSITNAYTQCGLIANPTERKNMNGNPHEFNDNQMRSDYKSRYKHYKYETNILHSSTSTILHPYNSCPGFDSSLFHHIHQCGC